MTVWQRWGMLTFLLTVVLTAWAPSRAIAQTPPSTPGAMEPAADRASPSDGPRATVPAPVDAKHRGRVVHVFRAPLGERQPSQRAETTIENLEQILARPAPEGGDLVRIRQHGDIAVLSVNGRKLLSLGPADAEAAGYPHVRPYAEEVRNEIADFLARERSRKSIANEVLSWSLVVFFGLLLFLLIPRVHRSARQARKWVRSHHERMPTLRFRGTELTSPGMVQSLTLLLISAVGIVLQITLLYVYVVVSLGLFEATEDWVPQLNRVLASPFRTLIDRITDVFPTAALTLAVALLIVPAYRIVGQIFDGIAQGDIEWRAVPRYLARPLKHLFLVVLVVGSILVLGPLVSKQPDALLARLGSMALIVLGIGLIPMAATFLWGVAVVLGRTYRRGAWFQSGDRVGVIDDVTLLELIIRSEEDGEGQPLRYRIPHLWLAFHPTTVAPKRPPLRLRFPVSHDRHRAATAQQLTRAVQKVHPDAKLTLEAMETSSVVYRVSVPRDGRAGRHEILTALVAALRDDESAAPAAGGDDVE